MTESHSEEKPKSNILKLDFLFTILVILVVSIGIYMNVNDNPVEIVLTNVETGDLHLYESKYFWGGVWFKKDILSILSDRFKMDTNSIIGHGETVYLPYQKVRKVKFNEQLYIYKITIESDGRLFNDVKSFYIRKKDNYDLIKNKIIEVGKDQFVYVEDRTIFNRITDRKRDRPLPKF